LVAEVVAIVPGIAALALIAELIAVGIGIGRALPLIAEFVAVGAGPLVAFFFPSAELVVETLATITLQLPALTLIAALELITAALTLAACIAHIITRLADRVMRVIATLRVFLPLTTLIRAALVLISSRLIGIIRTVLIGLSGPLRCCSLLADSSLARLCRAGLASLARLQLPAWCRLTLCRLALSRLALSRLIGVRRRRLAHRYSD